VLCVCVCVRVCVCVFLLSQPSSAVYLCVCVRVCVLSAGWYHMQACLMKDSEKRPSAKQLLQHEWLVKQVQAEAAGVPEVSLVQLVGFRGCTHLLSLLKCMGQSQKLV